MSGPSTAKRAQLRAKLFKQQDGKCFYCGRQMVLSGNGLFVTIEHKIPLADGGGWKYANLAGACYPCNQQKGVEADQRRKAQYALKEAASSPLERMYDFICGGHAK